jgi:hypothetical protein
MPVADCASSRAPRLPAVVVGFDIVRIEAERLIVVADGAVEVASVLIFNAADRVDFRNLLAAEFA